MIELTEQQRQALVVSEETPATILDPKTKEVFVLVPQKAFAKLRGVLHETDAPRWAPLLAELDAEDWEDISAYEKKP